MQLIIPIDHPCLAGHFPGNPIVPGVVVLDHVLQALRGQEGGCAPLTLSRVKFYKPLRPGQIAQIQYMQSGQQWQFKVFHNDVIAQGVIVMGGVK